jgi:hypothetical protein
VVHAKMPNYNVSINQRSKSSIQHQNNQPTFLIEKIVFILSWVSYLLKKVHKCRIPRYEIHLVLEQKR